jgi:crotonobetaine/carnitine-CoA ligase
MAKAWHDPRVPADVDCVLRPLLERRAAETPDKVFALFANGSAWTYREALHSRPPAAVGLRRLGVEQGDTVLSWLPNGPDALRVWFGLKLPRRDLCADQSRVPRRDSRARGRQLPMRGSSSPMRSSCRGLEPIGRARLAAAVVVGDTVEHDRRAHAPRRDRACARERPICRRSPARSRPGIPSRSSYTSGTTGPSKGVMSSYLQLYSMGVESLFFIGPEDRCMVNLPLFHVGGTAAVYAMLAKGGSIAVVDAFDTARFWSTVRETARPPRSSSASWPASREAAAQPSRSRPPAAHRHHGAAR